MSETITNYTQEILPRRNAMALAIAARAVGARVTALANEGERYITPVGQEAIVPEGQMHIGVRADVDREVGTEPLYARADEIKAEMLKQYPPTPQEAKAA